MSKPPQYTGLIRYAHRRVLDQLSGASWNGEPWVAIDAIEGLSRYDRKAAATDLWLWDFVSCRQGSPTGWRRRKPIEIRITEKGRQARDHHLSGA